MRALLSRLRTWLEAHVHWLRAPELGVGALLVVAGVLVVIFLSLGSEVAEGDTEAFDHSILLALRHTPDDPVGPRWLEDAMVNLSALGSVAVTILVCAIAVGYFWLGGRQRYALLVFASTTGAALLMAVLKRLYERPRPSIVRHLDPLDTLSFPSGHSTISAAMYMTLAVLIARTVPQRRLRVFAVVTGVTFALLIGFTRMYLGVHYPTDVVAGWTLGLAWALTCGVAARYLARRGQVEPAAAGSEGEAAGDAPATRP